VCVRGASALGALLARHPDAKVRVLVVWEPVLDTDVGPPTDAVRAPLRDPRVVEFWDAGRWLSPRAIERARIAAAAAGTDPPPPDAIAWDIVALFPAGTRWEEPFPVPSWYGAPVERSLGPIEAALAK
jgi:hypothetical protein